MKHLLVLLLCSTIGMLQVAAQHTCCTGRPDDHGPIGVMGDHTHLKGGLMVSYRYQYMSMSGMRSGTEDLSSEDVLSTYVITPTDMPMQMHMIGLMYAFSDKFTLMAMGHYMDKEMTHLTRMGGEFTTSASGLGDTWITGLYSVFEDPKQRGIIQLGVRIPTGSIDVEDVTPMSEPNKVQLPYPMQLGTGTWDLKPGFTYIRQWPSWTFGAQGTVQIPLSENSRNYKWGVASNVTAWGSYKISKALSASVRASAYNQGQIEGADSAYDMAVANSMVPTVFPENFGGSWLYLGGGLNFYIPTGTLRNLRIGAEYEYPVVQDLNGVQMKASHKFTIGIQYSLGL